MSFKIDLRVAELLASRLCHDLVGPVGAVNNGLELLTDDDIGGDAESVALVSRSARHAGNILQFYRLAYGLAGQALDSDLSEPKRLTERFLGDGKVKLDWQAVSLPQDAPEGLPKLLLNLIALAVEALPRGGTVVVTVSPGWALKVAAVGEGAALRPETAAALAPDILVDGLTPRQVQAYFTALLAGRLGGRLLVEPGDNRVLLTATTS